MGWEVWLDGQEITQFTYFQQAGGQLLDPVSVEITYGLERIAIALQRVRSFRDIRWSPTRTDGDVNLQAEQEHSKILFRGRRRRAPAPDVQPVRSRGRGLPGAPLVLPAHDYVLKCSHTFNVLDTRGAIGVTERQALFGRMRDLSRRVAEAYLAQRQGLEFPWLVSRCRIEYRRLLNGRVTTAPSSRLPAPPFLLEIGTEELPAADLDAALEQLRARLPALLDELRLSHGDLAGSRRAAPPGGLGCRPGRPPARPGAGGQGTARRARL